MRVALATGLTIAALLGAAPCQARDYYYFYKAGVDRQAYAEDRLTCEKLAGGVNRRAGPTTIYVPQSTAAGPVGNAAAVAIATLFAGLLLGGESRAIVNAVERTCMADKGYGRYRVEKRIVQAIDKLPSADERVDRYFTMATAATPTGERIKE